MLLERLEVGAEVARVLVEVFVGAELQRVDEDRDDHGVGELPCAVDEGEVALVQRAHGRNECDGAAGELLAQRGDRLDDDRAAIDSGRQHRALRCSRCLLGTLLSRTAPDRS